MARRYTYDYPRPAVTADVVIFTMRADGLALLLIKRAGDPFRGTWALPGGFVNENEALHRAAARELAEETEVTGVPLEQLGAFGDPGRDPRGHTVTIAYFTFVVADSVKPQAGDDAAEAEWHAVADLDLSSAFPATEPKPARARRKRGGRRGGPIELAFDHAQIIALALYRLRERLDDPLRAARFDIVPSRFTLAELQRVHEVILGRTLDKRNFRARMLAHGFVEPVAGRRTGKHRPAQLYRWKRPGGDAVKR